MSKKAKQLIVQPKVKELKRLNLSYCGLTNLATEVPELFELTDLEELHLNDNQLTEVSGLSRLNGLTNLNLQYNKLTDVSELTCLTNLTTLFLSDNVVNNVNNLVNLKNLTKLNLRNNPLTDISPLSGLMELQEFYYHTDIRYDNNYWSFQNPNNGYVALRLQNGDIVRGCNRYSQEKFISAVVYKYGNSHPYIEWAMSK